MLLNSNVTKRYVSLWYVTKQYVTKRMLLHKLVRVTQLYLLQNGMCYKTVCVASGMCYKTVRVSKW
jgi:hypothetical protein